MTREVMWRFRWGVIHPHGMLRPSGGERQRAKGLPSTAKVDAYHTVTQEQDEPKHRNVYHNHDDCPDGKRILPENKRSDKDNRPRCDACVELG